MRSVEFRDLGLTDYKEAWDYQELLFNRNVSSKLEARKAGQDAVTKNYLLFCEHPHVYTLGKSGSEDNLLVKPEELSKIDASYYKINRGGDITYHGPGQIVAYPIFDLDLFFTDIHKYLRYLEEAVILTLSTYGIIAGRYAGYTGVWLDPEDPDRARKICAMGIKCSRWITMHGMAFNVNTDLGYFNNIVPCGIEDKSVTSMKNELGKELNIEDVKSELKLNLANIFDFDFLN